MNSFQEIEKLQRELDAVKATCQRLKEEADVHQETFETEKASWLDEKEKVIRYQKQLQLNYVQVLTKQDPGFNTSAFKQKLA